MTMEASSEPSVTVKVPLEPQTGLTEVVAKRVVNLQEQYMQNMLQYKGGTFIKEYLAPSTEQARNNFPNALQLRFRGFTNDIKKVHQLQGSPLQDLLPFDKRRKRRETASDSTSTLQLLRMRRAILSKRIDVSCTEAGQPSAYDPNYLHLCKICSAKRILPPDRYPRVLNEVFCMDSDSSCLGNGNGKCVPTIFNVHILKRKNDVCRLCVKDNEPLAINDWELYTEPISVGCECMLDKNSDYKRHWFHSRKNNYSNDNISPIGR